MGIKVTSFQDHLLFFVGGNNPIRNKTIPTPRKLIKPKLIIKAVNKPIKQIIIPNTR